MRLRTNIVIAWAGLLILLWAGTFWSVRWVIASSVRLHEDARFEQTFRSLRAAESERIERMRRGCRVVMTIPALRGVIAQPCTSAPGESLQGLAEPLEALRTMMESSCVCLLDASGGAVAQSTESPWPTLNDLRSFLSQSPQAGALIRGVFESAAHAGDEERPLEVTGLWPDGHDLYHVVGMPLIFDAGAEGVLITATRVSDDMATSLSQVQDCEMTFFTPSHGAASSLPPEARHEIERAPIAVHSSDGGPFEMTLAGRTYRAARLELKDPCSGAVVGSVLVQRDLAEPQRLLRNVAAVFLLALVAGLAAIATLARAVTRPAKATFERAEDAGGGDRTFALGPERARVLPDDADAAPARRAA